MIPNLRGERKCFDLCGRFSLKYLRFFLYKLLQHRFCVFVQHGNWLWDKPEGSICAHIRKERIEE